jgi:hypothetical protein
MAKFNFINKRVNIFWLFVFCYSNIKWLIDNKHHKKLIDSTSKITAVKEVADNSKTENNRIRRRNRSEKLILAIYKSKTN